jgi:hypothetical protein
MSLENPDIVATTGAAVAKPIDETKAAELISRT